MHSILKSSHHGTSKTYHFVPWLDFSGDSEINWSKQIPDIDIQLYQKYGLTDEEVSFIEQMIKPMD